ncbi:MAG: exodeoxyribonuclease V subunit alpha [Candidatus Sericytochromatia bacterium]|nr:exodeoxyribonuclease V subunit alpha [Candidatus Sericytochromatia bacterium]
MATTAGPAPLNGLAPFQDAQILNEIDCQFAKAMLAMTGETGPELALGLALASRAPQSGHVCLTLSALSRTVRVEPRPGEPVPELPWPEPEACLAALRASALVGDPASTGTPLVLDGDRLYLRRFWVYQAQLAKALSLKAATAQAIDPAALQRALWAHFPQDPAAEPNRQRLAALVACLHGLTVITGGPGTGKTTTVTRLLGLLQDLAGTVPLRIALAAPTGKAAARLAEAIRTNRAKLPEHVQALIPTEATTIHRLLGFQRRTPAHFYHDRANPLPYDVIIVDEASMIPLALMAKLVDAVPPQARLIFLGDQDQLASVEAGAVLRDLCPPGDGRAFGFSVAFGTLLRQVWPDVPASFISDVAEPGLRDCVVHLTVSHRFGADSGIGQLARAINSQDVDAVLRILRAGTSGVTFIETADEAGTLQALRTLTLEFAPVPQRGDDPAAALTGLDRFAVLSAHRNGALGVAGLNRTLQGWLKATGKIDPDGEWFIGRPVLITENDREQQLFNGDIGLVLSDVDRPALRRVYFPSAGEPGWRAFAPGRLPAHDSAYALTIHKSQGSEFHQVAVVLPGRESPIVTKELLYTAITRAKHHVTVIGSAAVLASAIRSSVQRASGLQDRLW